MRRHRPYLAIVLACFLIGVMAGVGSWIALAPVRFFFVSFATAAECAGAREPVMVFAYPSPRPIEGRWGACHGDGRATRTLFAPSVDHESLATTFGARVRGPFMTDSRDRETTSLTNAAVAAAVSYVVLLLIVIPARLLRR